MTKETFELPALQNAETRLLYSEGLKIEAAQLQSVLNLSRGSLIADLETILADSMGRFTLYQTLYETAENENIQDVPLHAIMLLGEIGAFESLPKILNWLTGTDDLLDFYLGDHITETLWESLYKLLPGNTGPIEDFLENEQVNDFARSAVTDALAQWVLHEPEQKATVLSTFQNVFDHSLQQPGSDIKNFLALAISEVINIRGIELIPVVEKLFDAGLVDEFATGPKEEVVEAIQHNNRADSILKEILPVQVRYQRIVTNWYGYTGKEEMFDSKVEEADWADWEEDNAPEEKKYTVRTEPKIGRNDPCICGSGKKYKKCCLSKLAG